MLTLNSRCRDILLLILRSSGPSSASRIAKQRDLTPRMVRFALRDVERWLNLRGVHLVKQPGVGIRIDVKDSERRALIRELVDLSDCVLYLSADERREVIILSLLTAEAPLVIKHFEVQLNVSRTTVIKDLDQSERWFTERGLSLVRRPNFGCSIEGAEGTRRETLVDFLFDTAGAAQLISSCDNSATLVRPPRQSDVGFQQVLREFLDILDLRQAQRFVRRVGGTGDIHFSDEGRANLILHLAFLMRRVTQGCVIEATETMPSILDRRECRYANEIVDEISSLCGVDLGQGEMLFVARQILRSETSPSPVRRVVRREQDVAPDILDMVDTLISAAAPQLHPALRVDEQLKQDLAAHLSLVLDKLRLGISTRNPLLADLRRRYPAVCGVANECVGMIEEEIGRQIPETEVGYIAMSFIAAMERLQRVGPRKPRVLLVCHAGVATSGFLLARMRAEFPDVQIVDVVPTHALQSRLYYPDVDLVVSTVPLEITSPPVVVTNPLLDENDVESITQMLKVVRERITTLFPGSGTEPKTLIDLLTPEMLLLRAQARGWEEAVSVAGLPLVNAGAVTPGYVTAMKGMIVEHGPYMVLWPGVVLLHAHPQDGVRYLSLSLVTFEPAVPFGHETNDPVDVAIALGAVDGEAHLRALMQMHAMVTDAEAMEAIRRATDKREVLEIVAAFSNS